MAHLNYPVQASADSGLLGSGPPQSADDGSTIRASVDDSTSSATQSGATPQSVPAPPPANEPAVDRHDHSLSREEQYDLAPELRELEEIYALLDMNASPQAYNNPSFDISITEVRPLTDAIPTRGLPAVTDTRTTRRTNIKPIQPPKPAPRRRRTVIGNQMDHRPAADNNQRNNLNKSSNSMTSSIVDNKTERKLNQGYTVGEGAMDAQGNILADDEKEALTKFHLFIQKGKLKEQRERYAEAAADFKEALRYQIIARGENHLDVAKTHGLLGRIHHKFGHNKDAAEELNKELQIYENHGYCKEYGAADLWQVHDVLAQVYDNLREPDIEIRHYELAIEILVASTYAPPERLPHMHNNVGNAYRNVGKYNEARKHLEKAKEMMMLMHCFEPVEDMAKVHSSLGDLYKDLGMYHEAIEELEQCIKIREKTRTGSDGALLRGTTHQTLSSLYEQIGNAEKAKEHEDKSKLGLKGLMGSKEEREEVLRDLTENVKGHNANLMMGRLAAGLTASDDINKAQTYQAADDNKNAIIYYEKGIQALNELPEEVKNSEQLLSTLALCYNNVGNAYRKTNQWKLAEEKLRQALDIRRRLFADEPSDDTGSTLFNLGHLLQGIGGRANTEEALKLHKECLDMYLNLAGPTGKHKQWIVSLYRGLAVGHERLGNSRGAIEMYEQAKELLVEPGDADELRAVCNNVGNSYESIGDFKNAEKNIMQALDMAVVTAVDNPDTELQNHIAAGHNNLGVLYQTWDKLEKALHHLEESLKIREKIKEDNMEAAHDCASSHHNIGNTLAKLGRYEEALAHYRKELEIRENLGSDTTGAKVAMSQVYDKLGRTAEAEELLNDSRM
ncbi:tetratricopeptide repeat protein 28-like [Watersipora subatra]|uniref:tetratricopeptide repeat protein 28-like n=1 Tax=Watersipora subatra TaxID=2589382 RepID=UPI00355B5FB2